MATATSLRPNQQQLVYRAQSAVNWAPGITRVRTIDQLQQACNDWIASDWFAERYPTVWDVEVADHSVRRSTASCAQYNPTEGGGLIELTPFGRTLLTLAHELAHICTHARHGEEAGSRHGPHYAREYLIVVYHALGQDAYLQLHASFNRHGVQSHPCPDRPELCGAWRAL